MAVQITSRFDGEKVKRSLHTVGAAIPKLTRRRLAAGMKRAQKRITTYPPELPRQVYVRTGNYGRSWAVVQNGMSFTLQGRAIGKGGRDYTRYVGGYADGSGQAEIHAGRWMLAATAVDQELATMVSEVEGDISAVLQNEGMGT